MNTTSPTLPGQSSKTVAPASFAQRRLWLIDRLEPGNPFYNLPQVIRCVGSLDAAALRESLEEIVVRHEALRTTFTEAGGQPVQVIAADARFGFRTVDLTDLPDSSREET
ncbi:MAG TPA: condensation domain-containing protein, partial [Thermoanaerobaculia bacterium]|nr:condensation domain-containing protein [Thermoanaerobaculia bacterium]